MNANPLLAALLLVSPLATLAEEQQTKFDAFAPAKTSVEWKPHPALWRELLSVKRDTATVSIGKTDFVVGGPLIGTFRRPRDWSDLNLGEKILSLPIINLFVPQPMPQPPGGGKYFAWGDSSLDWATVARGVAPGSGRFTSAVNHEPTSGLFFLGW